MRHWLTRVVVQKGTVGKGSMLSISARTTAYEIQSRAAASSLVANDNVHLGVALNKTRDVPTGLAYYFNSREAFEHLIPQNL